MWSPIALDLDLMQGQLNATNHLMDVMLFLMFSDSKLWSYLFFLVILKAHSIIVFVKWTYIPPTMTKGTWPYDWALPTPHV